MAQHETTLGRASLDFAEPHEIDTFVETLGRFERGELGPDQWRAFRLVAGTYGQRQEGDWAMIRAKIPQGILAADQLEAVADATDRFSRGFAHVTTRQNLQFHFMHLDQVGPAMAVLAEAGLTTREACGNAVRNVTTSPTAGVAKDEVFDPTPYARAFTRYFLRHPLSATLPRKFKVAFSGGGADHSFAHVNDLGFFARIQDDASGKRVHGFRVVVAGGTALMCKTGLELVDFLPAPEIHAIAEAVLRVFHARGDRVHRHKNRLKFLVKEMGWDAFKEAVHVELAAVRAAGTAPLPFDPEAPPVEEAPKARAPAPTRAEIDALLGVDAPRGPGIVPRFLPVHGDPDAERFFRTNVQAQRQAGFVTVTITVPLGDISSGRMRAMALLARSFGDGTVRTTAGQNLMLRWVPKESVRALHAHLSHIGLAEPDPDSVADVSSCPGAESCKLAVTQSRGVAELVSDKFRADRSLVDRAAGLVVKVSGCPNGCGLHHVAGIGLQGGLRKVGDRAVPQYFVYAGGDASGDAARFGRVVAKVPARRVPLVFDRLIALYEEKREAGESITAFLGRAPVAELRARLADLEKLDANSATEDDFVDLGETAAFKPETTEGECAA
jgi:sulfite reductase beta subunit-like hemoprotein